MNTKRLWAGFILVMVISFGVLLYYGEEIYRKAPPEPEKVVTQSGETLFSGQDIKNGQNVWQSIGGQELGTVWGHGAYKAPDWTADWLHKEAVFILNKWAEADYGKDFGTLSDENKAALTARLKGLIRKNRYDKNTGILTVPDIQAEAVKAISEEYAGLFMDGPQ